MLLTKEIEVVWNKMNRKRYEKKGYVCNNLGDTFLLRVEDLTPGCDKRVDVQCDVCGKIKNIAWNKYLKQHDEVFGDLCLDCCGPKREATVMEEYGVKNIFQSEEVKNKIKETMLEKYGADNPMFVDKFKKQQQQTTFEHFGVYNPTQSEIIKQRQRDTCIKNYGVINPMDDMALRTKAVTKQRESYRQNGKGVLVSKVELEMCNNLSELYGADNCFNSVDLWIYTLDCEVNINGCKVDVEYDGQYFHQNEEKDKCRDEYVAEHGYKILRVKGNRKVPTKEQLKEAIDYLVKDNHDYAEIILDI